MADLKKRKIDAECRIFNDNWTFKYLIANIDDKAVCLVCNETISVFKEYNLKRHFSTKHLVKYKLFSPEQMKIEAEKLKSALRKQQNVLKNLSNTDKVLTKASYIVAYKVAKQCKSFSDGEFVKECLLDIVELLSPEMTHLDESCDINNTSQLLIFIRSINHKFEITEELLSIYPMKDTTTGEDFFMALQEVLKKHNIKWDKIVNITTDGCPSLTRKNIGLLKRISDEIKKIPEKEIIFLHCMIHQETLCTRVLNLKHVVSVVTKVVNFIRGRALNHRQFVTFLQDIDCEFTNIPYHTEIRWLSLAKGQFVFDMFTNVTSFTTKLKLFSQQFQSKQLTHFPILQEREKYLKSSDFKKYEAIVNNLYKEFIKAFDDFKKIAKDLSLLELINLQSNQILKNQFTEKTVIEFYASLNPEMFKNMLDNAQKYLAFFGSTYICEAAFSLMKNAKSKTRSRITDENLGAILRIATSDLNPNFEEIMNHEHTNFNPSH
ncbi:hypothetical protein RN001_004910 [Aquatica leii]|uniref:SPIN-DOC-like zinc-finger domain-containing protein n=1 Tax=Aquatica leii TaxID=1421715 RepID=A0AAN7PF93_9COLE|nr:hypothetical protein RN001_004910 [Aquatica leii]